MCGAVLRVSARTSVQNSTRASHERRHLRGGTKSWHQNGRRWHAERRWHRRQRGWRIWRGGANFAAVLRGSGRKWQRRRSYKMMCSWKFWKTRKQQYLVETRQKGGEGGIFRKPCSSWAATAHTTFPPFPPFFQHCSENVAHTTFTTLLWHF